MHTLVVLLIGFLALVNGYQTNAAQCYEDLGKYTKLNYSSPAVSMQMLFSTGLGPGNFGNVYQCNALGKEIAQYCILIGYGPTLPVFDGLCVPASCPEAVLEETASDLLTSLLSSAVNFSSVEVNCRGQHTKTPLSAGGIVCIVILVLCASLALTGSVVDYLHQTKVVAVTGINSESEFLLNVDASPQAKKEVTPLMDFLLCFSIQSNLGFLVNDKHSSGPFGMLNGLRVLMMFWVILGHAMFFQLFTTEYDNAGSLFTQLNDSFSFQFYLAAEYAVDVFFFLSGFLVVYLTYKEMKSGKGVSWIYYYVHRYWRLTPVYMLLLFIYWKLVPSIFDGPLWFMYSRMADPACSKYWWTNLIYINNLYPNSYGDSCFGWAWYLANDMQFFCLVPIVLLIMKWNKKVGWALIAAIIAMCFFMNGYIMGKFYSSGPSSTTVNDKIYPRPWTRVNPYILGVAMAIIVLDYSKVWTRLLKNVTIRWTGYVVSFGLVIVLSYSTYHQDSWGKTVWIMYTMFSRFSFSLAISIFLLICLAGYGGVVNWALSGPFWPALARLTYCAYLIHPIVMFSTEYMRTTSVHYSWSQITYSFIGSATLSYALALVFHLLVEKPCSNIERMLMKRVRGK